MMDIGVADILASTLETTDKTVFVNVGDSVSNQGYSLDLEVWGQDGFISRPNDPGTSGPDDGACRVLWVQDGQTRRVIATRDARYDKFVGTMALGDRAIVSNSAARLILKQATDTISLVTVDENASSDANSVMLSLVGKGASETTGISLVADGCFITLTKNRIVLGCNGGPTLELDGTDGKKTVTICGTLFNCATSGGCLGVVPGTTVVPPAQPTQAVIFGLSGILGTASKSWTIAP